MKIKMLEIIVVLSKLLADHLGEEQRTLLGSGEDAWMNETLLVLHSLTSTLQSKLEEARVKESSPTCSLPLPLHEGHVCISKILKEREHQDTVYGGEENSATRWMAILGEEYGEACRAVLDRKTDLVEKEVIQIAAVALAILEDLESSKTDLKELKGVGEKHF